MTLPVMILGELHHPIHSLRAEGYNVLVMPKNSVLTNTYQIAVREIRKLPTDRVASLDTKLVSMALGFQVLTAAHASKAGANLAECRRAAQQFYGTIGACFTVVTLKYLAAGGRINSARRLLGAAINIKPVLKMRAGKIELESSIISHRKAVARMLDLVEEGMNSRTPVHIAVCHTAALEPAMALMETVHQRFSPASCIRSEFSAVIDVRVGPKVLGIIYQAGMEEPVTAGAARSASRHSEERSIRNMRRDPAYV